MMIDDLLDHPAGAPSDRMRAKTLDNPDLGLLHPLFSICKYKGRDCYLNGDISVWITKEIQVLFQLSSKRSKTCKMIFITEQ